MHPFDREHFEELERRMQRSLEEAKRMIQRADPREVCGHCLEWKLCFEAYIIAVHRPWPTLRPSSYSLRLCNDCNTKDGSLYLEE